MTDTKDILSRRINDLKKEYPYSYSESDILGIKDNRIYIALVGISLLAMGLIYYVF